MNDIVRLSACELSAKIHRFELSCVDVMAAYVQHIDEHNPKVNAIVSRVPTDSLLLQAKALDERLVSGEQLGWMAGFPIAPKDLALTAGIASTEGSPIYASYIPDTDSLVVKRMREAGAIFIGKTNTPEFGLGSQTYNNVFGSTRNAFDPSKTCGGSSGGAAVALAMRLLPVADGSDMGGSLRNPAAWANLFGFRPSMGRVPRCPTSDLFYNQLSTDGPMGKYVTDIAMLYSVQAGYDSKSPLSIADAAGVITEDLLPRDFGGCKIGWMGDFRGHVKIEAELMRLCEESLVHFKRMSCDVIDICPDFDMQQLWRSWIALRSFSVGGSLLDLYQDPDMREQLKPEAIWECEHFLSLSAKDIYEAGVTRTMWFEEMSKLFEHVDFLVLPSTQVQPFDVSTQWPSDIEGTSMDTYHRWMEIAIGPTLAGMPALSVPAGFSASGLPFGLQIVGRFKDDLGVLQLGYAWEKNTSFVDRISPLLPQT